MSDNLPRRKLKEYKELLRVSHIKYEGKEKDELSLFRDYYKGKQWHIPDGTYDSYKDKPVDNVIFSNIKSTMPSINFRDPKIFTRPRRKPYRLKGGAFFDTIAGSVVLEIMLNYYYRELEIKREVNRALLDALVGHRGIIFIGYSSETEIVNSEKDKEGELDEVNELIKSDSPFTMRIKPEDFRMDPEAEDGWGRDARWIAIKDIKPLDKIKDNPDFINTKDLKPNYTIDTSFKRGQLTKTTGEGEEIEGKKVWDRVEFWTIWDKERNKIISVVDNHDKAIQYKDWPIDYKGGFPTEILFFNDNPDDSLPIADLEIYADSQDELNRIRSLQLSHIKRISQRRYLMQEDKITPDEQRKLENGGDGTIIKVSSGSVVGALEPLKDATISQDIYMVAKLLKESIREESGVAIFEKGGAQKFDTATEPALIQQGVASRRSERVTLVEDFIIRIIRKLALILQQTLRKKDIPLTEEQFKQANEFTPSLVEKIGGSNADILLPWLTASKEDIAGEYDFEIEIGSTKPINEQTRRQDAMFLLQAFGQDPLINQFELRKKALEAFDIKEIEKLLRKPEEVAKGQEESQKTALEMEIAKDKPKRDTDLAKTQLKVAAQREATQTNAKVSLLTAALSADKDDEKEAS